MKIVTSSGKKKIKISKKEWEGIGKKAGWMSEGDDYNDDEVAREECSECGRFFDKDKLDKGICKKCWQHVEGDYRRDLEKDRG